MNTNATSNNPSIIIKTSMGVIEAELFQDKAPKGVANFLEYVKSDFFTNTIFHRVIPNFMIQGGGFEKNMQQKTTKSAIENEADNGLINDIGTLAYARTSDPHSATSQFFINVANNSFLNHSGKSANGWGYAVFGKVTDGMQVVNEIQNVKTGNTGGHGDVPIEPVIIESITIK